MQGRWRLMCGVVLSLSIAIHGRAALVAHWPLDDSARDTIGGHDGTVHGDVQFGQAGASSHTQQAAQFQTGSIEIPRDPAMNPASYTVVTWAKTRAADNLPYSVITSREDIGPRKELYGYILYQFGNRWQHWTGVGPSGCSPTKCWDVQNGAPAATDQWQHLAISFDAPTNTKSLYIDGTLIAATTDQAYVPNTTRSLYIGSGTETGDNFYFNGQIDDVGLYDTALSLVEIQDIRDHGIEPSADLPGDFNSNGQVDVDDINQLVTAIAQQSAAIAYDLSQDGQVSAADLQMWIKDLRKSWFGDANLDGEFNSGDLVDVFAAGKFETGAPALWAEGDWDANGVFDSGDLVQSFQDGGFERGPRAAVSAVPEPSSILMITASLWLFLPRRRPSMPRPTQR